ncbi:MAG: lipopolysaccharide biosynthesis protein, partial [Syntrophothermus sp.]
DLIRLIIGSNYRSGLDVIPIVLLGYLFNGIYYNFTAGIFIKEKTKHLPYITGIGALVNIAVNYALIPYWGMTGAAFATLASYVIMAAVLFAVTQKFYKIDYEYIKIAGIFACIGIFAAGFYTIGINGPILYKTGLFILFFILLMAFRIVTLSEIASIRNLVVGKFFRLPVKK